jgi:Lar family restriction alleviation protein
MEELKPCPFNCDDDVGCGTEFVVYHRCNYFAVSCAHCGAQGSYEPSKPEAIEKWNTRTTAAPDREMLKRFCSFQADKLRQPFATFETTSDDYIIDEFLKSEAGEVKG